MTNTKEKDNPADAFARKVFEAKAALDDIESNFYRTMFLGLERKIEASEQELIDRIAKNLWDTSDALHGLARRFENDES